MILPTKHIRPDRALLTVGGDILACLEEPTTVSRAWDEVRKRHDEAVGVVPISYDWFILALDLLYITKAVSFESGVLHKGSP